MIVSSGSTPLRRLPVRGHLRRVRRGVPVHRLVAPAADGDAQPSRPGTRIEDQFEKGERIAEPLLQRRQWTVATADDECGTFDSESRVAIARNRSRRRVSAHAQTWPRLASSTTAMPVWSTRSAIAAGVSGGDDITSPEVVPSPRAQPWRAGRVPVSGELADHEQSESDPVRSEDRLQPAGETNDRDLVRDPTDEHRSDDDCAPGAHRAPRSVARIAVRGTRTFTTPSARPPSTGDCQGRSSTTVPRLPPSAMSVIAPPSAAIAKSPSMTSSVRVRRTVWTKRSPRRLPSRGRMPRRHRRARAANGVGAKDPSSIRCRVPRCR